MLKGRFRGDGAAQPDELIAAAMTGERAVDLGRGLTLRARRVAGAKRLELEGWAPSQVPGAEGGGLLLGDHRPPAPGVRPRGRRGEGRHRADRRGARGGRRGLTGRGSALDPMERCPFRPVPG